ncbi:MAG TPA: glycosyltransferase [Candidatus Omnitrophota bacterium]|nr:glycosyltransferase [Candidatus Omnitrophota bacterium]HRZ15832.1 glycosyltransferase [Candidatus Omnitrophota bacterium]
MNELSIIVPCIYSTDRLPRLIDELSGYLMTNPADIDLIVVANEQAVAAEDIVAYVRAKYPWIKFTFLRLNGGIRSYGALVRFGLAYSTSQYAVLLSAHGDDDSGMIPRMLVEIRKGFQVVQAVRYAHTGNGKNIPLRFKLYQSVYRGLTRVMLGLNINDSTYGFKMFDRVFLQALGLTQNGFSISPEITFKALLARGRVAYLVSAFKDIPLSRDFKLYKEGIGYLWLLYRGCMHRLGVSWF